MIHDCINEIRMDDQSAQDKSRLDAEHKEQLKRELLSRAGREMTIVRGQEREWRKVLPGVFVQLLHEDADSGIQTALWRMQPGARIPAHPHAVDEECFVLEGSLEHREQRFKAGDYMLAPAGTRHSTISSAEGVLMLIRGERVSWKDRMLMRTALALGR
jgi:quercetin dioxygenase-like cupin family protein